MRVLQPRDVAAGSRAAPHVLPRQGRRAPHPHRQARQGRLAAARQGVRPARGGAAVRRRHAGPQPPRAARPRADAEAPRAEPRPHRRRLPPADDDRPQRGEPPAGGVADLARPQGDREGSRRAGHRALPAQPLARAAPRQAADALRPPRVGLDRAGRRHGDVPLPRGVLRPRRRTTRRRASPRSSSRSTATVRPATSRSRGSAATRSSRASRSARTPVLVNCLDCRREFETEQVVLLGQTFAAERYCDVCREAEEARTSSARRHALGTRQGSVRVRGGLVREFEPVAGTENALAGVPAVDEELRAGTGLRQGLLLRATPAPARRTSPSRSSARSCGATRGRRRSSSTSPRG